MTEYAPTLSNPPLKPTSSERRWILWAAVIVMLITTLPYLLGYQRQGQDWRFTGFVFGVNDGNSYIAKMLSGASGAWLFRTPYTFLEQRGILAFFPYLLLGKWTSPPGQHEQLVALFHLYRFLGGCLAILATYDFISCFVRRIAWRRLGTLIVSVGGGLGWFLVLIGKGDWLGSLPLDFYSPETFGFLSLYGLPHLALARALLLWGLVGYVQGPHSYQIVTLHIHSGIVAGFLWLLMGFFQPLTIVVAWAVMAAHLTAYGLFLLWQGQRSRTDFHLWLNYFRRAILAGLVSAPFVLYSFLALRGDPFLSGWTAQNRILSPSPWHYLVAYGGMLPLAFVGARYLLRANPVQSWLLAAWVILLPALAYAPFNLQRRLPEGVWVAIITLAMAALDQERKPARAWVIPIAFTFPTALLLLMGGITSTITPRPPIFRPASEVKAFLYLADHTEPGDLVLTTFEVGNALPAWTPVRVVIGHGPESVGLAELQPRVEGFFHTSTDDERQALLDEWGIQYVLWPPPQEGGPGAWDPHQAVYLREVFSQDGYMIFEVVRSIP